MARSRPLSFALATCALFVLASVMLGFTSAAHKSAKSHAAAERAAALAGEEGAVHSSPHSLKGMGLAGVCAAVLGALAAVALGRPASRVLSRPLLAGVSQRSALTDAPRGTGPPLRTSLCIQIC